MANEQLSLFSTEDQSVSLKDVALQLSVSQATIRNWIHSGFLNAVNGMFFQSDIDSFVARQLQGKLKSRANKIRKDSHNQFELSTMIQEVVQSDELSG